VPFVDPGGHQKPAAHGPVNNSETSWWLLFPAPYQSTRACLTRPGRTVPIRRRPSTRRSSRLERPSDPEDRRPSRQHSRWWPRLQSGLHRNEKKPRDVGFASSSLFSSPPLTSSTRRGFCRPLRTKRSSAADCSRGIRASRSTDVARLAHPSAKRACLTRSAVPAGQAGTRAERVGFADVAKAPGSARPGAQWRGRHGRGSESACGRSTNA
jgi:hypothetical protein